QVLPDHARPVTPDIVKEVIRTLERRVNQLGVAEPVITEYGRTGDQVLVELPGVKDVAQAKGLIVRLAQLSLQMVEEMAPTRERLLAATSGSVPPGLEVVEGATARGEDGFYLLRREAVITGRDLKTTRVGVGATGEPIVEFTLGG